MANLADTICPLQFKCGSENNIYSIGDRNDVSRNTSAQHKSCINKTTFEIAVFDFYTTVCMCACARGVLYFDYGMMCLCAYAVANVCVRCYFSSSLFLSSVVSRLLSVHTLRNLTLLFLSDNENPLDSLLCLYIENIFVTLATQTIFQVGNRNMFLFYFYFFRVFSYCQFLVCIFCSFCRCECTQYNSSE